MLYQSYIQLIIKILSPSPLKSKLKLVTKSSSVPRLLDDYFCGRSMFD